MKVTKDKVTVYPPHALCKEDVSMIFSAVPSGWCRPVRKVRLSAMLQCADVAHFNDRTGTLNVISRGHTKEHTVHQILVELATIGLALPRRRGFKPAKKDVSKLESAIHGLVREIIPKLSKKKVWLEK